MQFQDLVACAANLHCFSPGMVTAGEPIDRLRVQLSRWVQIGRVARLHKGWYTLASPYRRVTVDLFVVACLIKSGSYVSLQSALSHHGMIPEYVPETTCVTTGRPQVILTPFGRIRYRHIKPEAFWGFDEVERGDQSAFVARPEKALLDLVYLTAGAASRSYIAELRLADPRSLDIPVAREMADRFRSPRLTNVPGLVSELVGEQQRGRN